MTTRIIAVAGVVVAMAALPAEAGLRPVAIQALPGDREGVVVTWRARSGTAVVAMRSGRLRTVHALRRVTPGTRVRVDGIKWGTPTSGVTWSAPPRGIKWGIKWSRGGTYASRLTPLGGTRRMALRAVVVRRVRGGVVLGTRGGVVGVRMAVWLPKRGKGVNGVSGPRVGDTVRIAARFGPNGRIVGTSGTVLDVPRATVLPVSGRLSAIDTAARSITISNVRDPGFGLVATMRVPTSVDMGALRLGREVSALAELEPAGTLRTLAVAPNDSFAAANDPAQQVVAPPPAGPDVMDLIRSALTRWDAGRAEGAVETGLYTSGRLRIQRAETAAEDGDRPLAISELEGFIAAVQRGIPAHVTPPLAANVLALAASAVDRLRG